MSKPSGAAAAVEAAIRQSQEEVLAERAEELRQLDLLDPVTPEEMADARADMGGGAGRLAVLAEARRRKAGRPKGALNRRTEDFVAYLSQFGSDPAVGAMILQSTPVEVLVELYGGKPIEWIDRQLRARELLMPYFHQKKPVAVDARITGVRIVEEVLPGDPAERAIEGSFVRLVDPDGPLEGEDG